MGDPKKPKKKYKTPRHPWEKARILESIELTKEYGFKNKTELWKVVSKLKSIRDKLKSSIVSTSKQGQKERDQLVQKLESMGLIKKGAGIDEILGLSQKDILERRLQTLVFRKGLARTAKQARQFITHGHIVVKGKKITSPNALIRVDEEGFIAISAKSPFVDENHPERKNPEENEPKKKVKDDKTQRESTKTG
jgi:small subunit ribosomal protein S4